MAAGAAAGDTCLIGDAEVRDGKAYIGGSEARYAMAARGVLIRDGIKVSAETEEELAAYNGGAMKGGYWWTDLNRVSACMEYLNEQLRSMGYETGYIPIRLDRPEIVLPGRLPEGYTELEYIESNGNQYIDSLIKPTGNTRVRCKVRFPTTNEGTWIFGARDGSGSKAYGFLSYQNQYRSDYDIARPLISASYGPDLLIDKDGGKTSVNGTLVDDAETFNFACQYNLLIGTNSNTGTQMG